MVTEETNTTNVVPRTLVVDRHGQYLATLLHAHFLGRLLEAVRHLGRGRALNHNQVVLVHETTLAQQRRDRVVRLRGGGGACRGAGGCGDG